MQGNLLTALCYQDVGILAGEEGEIILPTLSIFSCLAGYLVKCSRIFYQTRMSFCLHLEWHLQHPQGPLAVDSPSLSL